MELALERLKALKWKNPEISGNSGGGEAAKCG
jgi:hypothetical protein